MGISYGLAEQIVHYLVWYGMVWYELKLQKKKHTSQKTHTTLNYSLFGTDP